jgi:hypothetical protein
MFVLEAHEPGAAKTYWAGGKLWSYHVNQAGRFMNATNAKATLSMLESFNELPRWQVNAEPVPWPEDNMPPEPSHED